MSVERCKPVHEALKAQSSPYNRKHGRFSITKLAESARNFFLPGHKKRRTEEPSSSFGDHASIPTTTHSQGQGLHEIIELPDDDSDICEVVMIDSTSMSRHEEKQPQRPGPPTDFIGSNIFSRQAGPSGSTTRSDPFTAGSPGPDTSSSSPSQARERVADFLRQKEKVGTPLNHMEVEGLMSMLQKASESPEVVEPYNPEPFRFSTTPSPTRSPLATTQDIPDAQSPRSTRTTRRMFAASTAPSSLPTLRNNVAQPSTSPRKVLTRNPNGEYRWTGGGSARVSKSPSPAARNGRYATMSNLSSKLPTKVDTKRRRVEEESDRMDEDKDDNGPTLTSPFTVPSMSSSSSAGQPSSTGPSLQPTPSLPSRIPRASLRPKSATPARPSPLRNVITESPPGSPPTQHQSTAPGGGTPPLQRTTTRAAAMLTEIIEKVTPPAKPDMSNPYQNASPVKVGIRREKRKVSGSGGVSSSTAVKARDFAKESSEMDVDNLSEKAKIEATVPKGVRSSRPSSGTNFLSKSMTESSNRRPLQNGFSANESYEDDQEVQPVAKKQKRRATVEDADEDSPFAAAKPNKSSAFGFGATSRPVPMRNESVTVEEVMDEDTPASSSSFAKPSEVIEPGDDNNVSAPSFASSSSSSKGAPTSIFGAKSSVFGKSSAPKEPSKLRETFVAEKEDEESSTSIKSAPVVANPFAPKINGFTAPKLEVNGIHASSSSSSSSSSASASPKDPKQAALELNVSLLPKYDFPIPQTKLNMDPAHVEARRIVMAMSVDELPKYDLTKPVPVTTPASTSTPAASTSSLPSFATPPVSTPAKEIKSFDWGAAGIKPKAAAGDGWTCGTCMLQNPASATVKCTVCDAPKPSSSSSSSEPSAKSIPAPAPIKAPEVPAPVKSFDWAAAGLAPKPQGNGSSWTCGTCMLQNPASATEKCTVCDTPKLSSSSLSGSEPSAKPAPASAPAPVKAPSAFAPVKSFDWAAAGLAPKPQGNGSSWTCGTCMLQNPASATEKCTVCDTPKS